MPKHATLDYRVINRNFDPAPMPGETFLPVPGYEGLYEVSDFGRIVSYWGKQPRVLTGSPNASGHIQAGLHRGGKVKYLLVHRLVAHVHLGPAPAGKPLVLHANDISRDNRLSNLRYGTSAQNNHDRVLNGSSPQANRTHCPRGHLYIASNTYVCASGYRHCISCKHARVAANRARKKGEFFDFKKYADSKFIERTTVPGADMSPVVSLSLAQASNDPVSA